MKEYLSAVPAGDSAVLIQFGTLPDVEINSLVLGLAEVLQSSSLSGIVGIIPAFTSILIEFDPLKLSAAQLIKFVNTANPRNREQIGRCFEVPVAYGSVLGQDLEDVANRLELTSDEVVRLHTSTDYRIFCLGFAPGFPLAGIVREELRIPRRAAPRTAVPAGSVAIAGFQTGIYPIAIPGGWHILGRTPAQLFSLFKPGFTPWRPGDYLRFRSISEDEYHELKRLSSLGEELVKEIERGRTNSEVSRPAH